jgi:hypothetical protein
VKRTILKVSYDLFVSSELHLGLVSESAQKLVLKHPQNNVSPQLEEFHKFIQSFNLSGASEENKCSVAGNSVEVISCLSFDS